MEVIVNLFLLFAQWSKQVPFPRLELCFHRLQAGEFLFEALRVKRHRIEFTRPLERLEGQGVFRGLERAEIPLHQRLLLSAVRGGVLDGVAAGRHLRAHIGQPVEHPRHAHINERRFGLEAFPFRQNALLEVLVFALKCQVGG